MSYFAAVLTRSGSDWEVAETSLDGCESVSDVGDVLRDTDGDVRLVFIEQDDEYAAIVRLDEDGGEPRAFLSDGHAADSYSVAALIAEDLDEVGSDDDPYEADEDMSEDSNELAAPAGHESAPLGDADIVDDLGTGAAELLRLCAHEGTLPIDVLVSVCEKAGCGPQFDELRG